MANETKETENKEVEIKEGKEMTAEEILEHAKKLAGAILDQCVSHSVHPKVLATAGAIILCTMLKSKEDVIRIIDTFTFPE
jgi:hypothetical protein